MSGATIKVRTWRAVGDDEVRIEESREACDQREGTCVVWVKSAAMQLAVSLARGMRFQLRLDFEHIASDCTTSQAWQRQLCLQRSILRDLIGREEAQNISSHKKILSWDEDELRADSVRPAFDRQRSTHLFE